MVIKTDSKSGRREQRPWFQMYPMDYFGSSKVSRMSAEERGVFTTILFRSWTDDGYEMDEEDLSDELDITVERLREIMAGRVGRALPRDEEGRYRSTRLEEERERAIEKAEQSKANGRKGGRPRKPKETQPVSNGTQQVPKQTQPLADGTQGVPSETALGPSETQPELCCAVLSCASDSPSTETPLELPPPNPPQGGSGRKRRGGGGDPLESVLGELAGMELPEPVTVAARRWRAERDERGLSLWSRSTWREQLRKARDGPDAWIELVDKAITEGFSTLAGPPRKTRKPRTDREARNYPEPVTAGASDIPRGKRSAKLRGA